MRKNVSDFEVQLGNPADIQPFDIKNPAPHLRRRMALHRSRAARPRFLVGQREAVRYLLIRQIATSIESALVPEIMPTTIRLCFRVKLSRCWAIGFIRFDLSLHAQTRFPPVFRLCNIR